MEASLAFRYAPGETFVNTKQRRIPVSFDAPVFTLSHTAGFKGVLGGEYNYNLTEIGLYRGTAQCGERSNAAISHAVCRRANVTRASR